MSFREPIRKKNSSQFNQTPASNPFQLRRRKVPKPPQEVVQLSPEQQKSLLEEQQLKAASFGYNGLEIPVHAPATPASPIQKQSASTVGENQQQPQVAPEVDATREQVEETVEPEEISGEEASQTEEPPNTDTEGEDAPPTVQSEVGSRNQQPQMPSLQAQLEKASRLGYNGLNVPVDALETPSPPVLQELTLDGVENEYQPEVIERANPVLNGLNQFKVQRQENSVEKEPIEQPIPSVTQDVEQRIQQSRGGGKWLDESVRQPMEQAFGADFSRVRIHTDSQSDQLNRSIQAKAFTTGQDIFFKQGEFAPESRGGQELLAHELTHVVQQTGGLRLSKEIRRQIQPEDEEKQPLQAKEITRQTPNIFRSKDIHLQPQPEDEEKQPLQAKELSDQTPIISRSKELLSSPQEQEEENETIHAKEFSNQIPAISPAKEMLSAPDAEPEQTEPLEAKEFSNQTLEVSQQKELGWQSEQNQEKSEPLQAKQLPELVFDSNLIQKKPLDGGDFTPSPPAIQRGLLSGIKNLADKGLEWITSKIIQPMKGLASSGWNAVKNFGGQISTAFQQANPQIWDVFQPQYLMFRMARNQRQQLFAQAIQQERQQRANAAKSQAGSAPNVNEPSQLERLDALATTVESGADSLFGVSKELVEGAVLGDFKENPSIWNTIGQIAIGFVPYAGQVADVRDLIASVKKLHESGYKDPWEWFNLVLVGVGFIPGIGDAIKAAGRGAKSFIRNSLKGVLKNADNLLRPVLKRAKGMLDGAKHYGKKFAQWASKIGPSLLKGVKQFGQKTLDFAKGAAQKARGLLTAVKSKVSGFVSSAVQKARDIIGQGKGLLGQAVGKFIGKAQEVFGGLKNRVSQAADSVKGLLQRGKQLATKVGQKVADVTGNAKNLLKEFTQGAIQKGKELLTRTKTFVQEQITKATEVGRKLVTQARQRTENLVRQGVKLAKDKVVPFIKEKIAGVKHRIKSFLEDKWNKLKEKLGIKDPEKPGKEGVDRGGKETINKAAEMPRALAEAAAIAKSLEATGTPIPGILSGLMPLKTRYRWIKAFDAEPKSGGTFTLFLIASKHKIISVKERRRQYKKDAQNIDLAGGHSYADHGAHTTPEQHRQRLLTGVTPGGSTRGIPSESSKFATHRAHVDASQKAQIELANNCYKTNGTLKKEVTVVFNMPGAGLSYTIDPAGNLLPSKKVDKVYAFFRQNSHGWYDLITMYPKP